MLNGFLLHREVADFAIRALEVGVNSLLRYFKTLGNLNLTQEIVIIKVNHPELHSGERASVADDSSRRHHFVVDFLQF